MKHIARKEIKNTTIIKWSYGKKNKISINFRCSIENMIFVDNNPPTNPNGDEKYMIIYLI